MTNETKDNLDRLLLVFVHGFRGTDTSFKVKVLKNLGLPETPKRHSNQHHSNRLKTVTYRTFLIGYRLSLATQ
jgi:hypothetical protein